MRIGKIASYIGLALLTVSCRSGINKPASAKAMEFASKYISGTELLEAQNLSKNITKKIDPYDYSHKIFYLDSILASKKEASAFPDGVKMVKDSAEGNLFRRYIFFIPQEPDNTRTGKEISDSLEKEVAKYFSGKEMLEIQKKAPIAQRIGNVSNENALAEYFGRLSVIGATRKGYHEGMQASRNKLGIK